jgi:hypothetical protein
VDEPMTQDGKGNWVPAKPVGLMCEITGCGKPVTFDDQYERLDKNLPNDWGNEPAFLCKEHSVGRKRITPDPMPPPKKDLAEKALNNFINHFEQEFQISNAFSWNEKDMFIRGFKAAKTCFKDSTIPDDTHVECPFCKWIFTAKLHQVDV